jgi:hypothetical protein
LEHTVQENGCCVRIHFQGLGESASERILQEISAGVGVAPIENQNPGSEQDQIAAYMMSRGMTPWTGPKQAVFLNGQPVPKELFNHAPIPVRRPIPPKVESHTTGWRSQIGFGYWPAPLLLFFQ